MYDNEIKELEKIRYDMATACIEEFWDYVNETNKEIIKQVKAGEIHEGF